MGQGARSRHTCARGRPAGVRTRGPGLADLPAPILSPIRAGAEVRTMPVGGRPFVNRDVDSRRLVNKLPGLSGTRGLPVDRRERRKLIVRPLGPWAPSKSRPSVTPLGASPPPAPLEREGTHRRLVARRHVEP